MADPVKKWDKARPFIRINAPSVAGNGRLRGDGHSQGTRRQDDFKPINSGLDQLVISQLIALTPSWARTETDNKGGNNIAAREALAEQEVFGPLKRSFQTWTDAPPLPWHTWYDWNFHLEPEPEFAHLRGFGNEDTFKKADPVVAKKPLPVVGGKGGQAVRLRAENARRDAKLEALVQGRTMELEWDCGAMGSVPGPMFGRDLAWPMTDWFVWAVGRSIYDGGHEAEAKQAESAEVIREQAAAAGVLTPLASDAAVPSQTAPAPPEEGSKTTRSELHPCKAIATARWEAHKFPGTDHFVPAIQFMFFANRRGGYKTFRSLAPSNGKDYEFIVDLPPPSGAFLPLDVPVGSTPDFAFNRLVLRQEPLVDFAFDAFLTINGAPGMRNVTRLPNEAPLKLASLEQMRRFPPRVELLPEAPGKPLERQAKVTIPLNAFVEENPDVDSYGVIVSIGWFDPDKQQGKDVKKVTVKLKKLVKNVIDHDIFKEEWRIKLGVNGRWFHHQFDGMGSNDSRDLNHEIVMHLHKDDFVAVSSHGAEVDLVDDVYANDGRDITLSDRDVNEVDLTEGGIGGDTQQFPIDWDKHVDGHRDPVSGNALPGSNPAQRAICRKLFDLMFTTFGDQNDPLGIIDPGRGTVQENTLNPRKVGEITENQEEEIKLNATATSEVGSSAELVRVNPDLANLPSDIDYRLEYSILVETQDALK